MSGKMLKKIIVAMIPAILLSFPEVSGNKAVAQFQSSQIDITYDPQTRVPMLRTTGKGRTPKSRSLSPAQKRLLARRAAIVDGYRNLTRGINQMHHQRRKGLLIVEETSGFLKGVKVGSTRFFAEGDVEVELFLPLTEPVESFQRVQKIFSGVSLPVCEVQYQKKKYISKEEYEELFRHRN